MGVAPEGAAVPLHYSGGSLGDVTLSVAVKGAVFQSVAAEVPTLQGWQPRAVLRW